MSVTAIGGAFAPLALMDANDDPPPADEVAAAPTPARLKRKNNEALSDPLQRMLSNLTSPPLEASGGRFVQALGRGKKAQLRVQAARG